MSVKNHAGDPKGKKLELRPRDGRTEVEVGPMMTGAENEPVREGRNAILEEPDFKARWGSGETQPHSLTMELAEWT